MTKRYFLKAASLMESVIAITIITTCSLVATLVYSSIINSTPPIKKYEYLSVVEFEIHNSMVNKDLSPFVKQFNGFSIEKINKNISLDNNINLIEFIVKTPKDTILFPIYISTQGL